MIVVVGGGNNVEAKAAFFPESCFSFFLIFKFLFFLAL